MPPRKSDARKSDVSAAAPAADASQITVADESVLSTAGAAVAADKSITEGGGGSSSKKSKDASAAADDKTTIEDLTLPKSIITRLAKGVLPANTQIQGNAILAMSKSTTVFINYLAAHANEITLNANKKTIMPADVFKALEEIEFDFLKEPLEAEFAKFNAIQTEKRNTYRQKVKATKTPGDDTDMGGDGGGGGGGCLGWFGLAGTWQAGKKAGSCGAAAAAAPPPLRCGGQDPKDSARWTRHDTTNQTRPTGPEKDRL
ncbi:hypothetical protein NLG97_g6148 [Lecanicillium saksenae]|uniref:Uncharacterized protein n=1 Tax=Lecanicillium saksenae TaxID=468837 RepID=A0ACC1QQK9_9HYPO|nr:hypothetical protein NLG97_g6148 [Lecanicillium saksenae]